MPIFTVLSILFTCIIVLISILYYLYDRSIKRGFYYLNRWSSYEVERGIRCNSAVIDPAKLFDTLQPKMKGGKVVKTVYDCFVHGLELSEDEACLGELVDNLTKYRTYSYSQVLEEAELIGKFLRSHGIQRQQNVGVYGKNSCAWVTTELACILQSTVTIALYDTLGLESIRHTVNETELSIIFCDSEDKLKPMITDRENFPTLKVVVLLHDNVKDPNFSQTCRNEGVEFLTWSEAKEIGAQHPEIKHDPPNPGDVFLIQYTSGTTGMSKGVILTHRNMVACISGAESWATITSPREMVASREVNRHDLGLLYLPLAHIYAQYAVCWFFYVGASTAFPSGNVQRLTLDAQIIKPTFFPLIPRIMNRVYSKVIDETSKGLKGWLFWQSYRRKRALFRKSIITRNSIYDWLVFRRLQNLLGGRVRIMTTGSAPVAADVLEFWRVAFGVFILEGYGQTETSSCSSAAIDIDGGNVGHPTCATLIRLLDVPELGYTNDNNPPQGEICLKGPIVTQGYYKRPDLTEEAFTADSWLLTGDIGEFLPSGGLRIIDRRKNIFKLSQGEYIAPEKIESVYAQCPIVGQVFVDGSSLQTYVIAIVVPDEVEAKKWASQNCSVTDASFADLCSTNKDFQKHVLNEMAVVGKEKGLNSLEQVKSIHLHAELFTTQNGLLTPSMKNKRNDLRKRFKTEIEALYQAGPMLPINQRG